MAVASVATRSFVRPARFQFKLLDVILLIFFLLYAGQILFPSHPFFLEYWDESRNANNALEMAAHGHWSTAYFGGVPDHWNTKPLLLIWVIAGLMKVGLPFQVALRLPSALAALGTVVVLYCFCRFQLRKPLAGIMASLLLLSATRFFGYHVAVSGDFDAFLCFFITVYALSFWMAMEGEGGRGYWLTLTGLSLFLAIATKGIAALMPLPGLLLFVLVMGRVKAVLGNYRIWLTLVAALAGAAILYGVREMFDPGYLNSVWHNEITGRYLASEEGHAQSPLFYVASLLIGFEPGLAAVLVAVWLIVRGKIELPATRSAAIFCAIVPATFLLILSLSRSKLLWYSAPSIPLFAALGGMGIEALIVAIAGKSAPRLRFVAESAIVCLLLTASINLYRAEGPARDRRVSYEEKYRLLLGDMKQKGMSGSILIFDDGTHAQTLFKNYAPVAMFYAELARIHGQQVKVTGAGQPLPAAKWVVSCDPEVMEAPPSLLTGSKVMSMDTCLVSPGI